MKLKIEDRGDSLLEVVISTVIMGVIGVLIISSIAVARPFADKMSLVGQTVQNLNSLSQSINLQSFAYCSPHDVEPYSFAQVASTNASGSTGFALTTEALPPVMVSTSSKQYPYTFKLALDHSTGPVTWTVEPSLPSGLVLNESSGVISGATTQAITAQYIFTAISGAEKATKNLLLTSALVQVLANSGGTWVPCESIPSSYITSAAGDGKVATYSYDGKAFLPGDSVSIWGASNPAFNGRLLKVLEATPHTFTVANPIKGSSVGGDVRVSTSADIQEVVVSTTVAGSPLQKIVIKAAL